MYAVKDDRVVAIETAPRPDIGAPLPALVCDEHRLVLAYIVSEPDARWDGTYAKVVSPDSPDEPIAIVAMSCRTPLSRAPQEAFESSLSMKKQGTSFPSARMYSAASSHSSIVAARPRFSSTGFRVRPTARSRG